MKNTIKETQKLTKSLFFYDIIGIENKIEIIWAHGWGMDHKSMKPLADSLKNIGKHYIIDLPGFGKSTKPKKVWGTKNYSEYMAKWIKKLPSNLKNTKRIWVGHSFGSKIGIDLASNHPELIDGLFLIAAAGIKIRRNFLEKMILKYKIFYYKFCKKIILALGLSENYLQNYFGSIDYKNAKELKNILIKIVSEDMIESAKKIKCPVYLIFGSKDNETPPEIGINYKRLIPKSKLFILKNQDHHSLIELGKHQVINILKKFIQNILKYD